MKKSMLLFFLVSVVFAVAQAQTGQFFYRGNYQFHYQQFPFGPLEGDFLVEGELDTTGFDPANLEGVTGYIEQGDTLSRMFQVAAYTNPDTSVDFSGVVLFSQEPITAGASFNLGYPGGQGIWFYVQGADSLIIPDNLDSLNYEDFFNLLNADYTFLSASGEFLVETLDDTSFTGTFSGLALDPNALVSISFSDGQFALRGFPPFDGLSAPAAPADFSLSVAPNPFNPTTQAFFTLHSPAPVRLRLFDLLGRPVLEIHSGFLPAGTHHFNVEGSALGSGIYFLVLEAPSGRLIREITLLR